MGADLMEGPVLDELAVASDRLQQVRSVGIRRIVLADRDDAAVAVVDHLDAARLRRLGLAVIGDLLTSRRSPRTMASLAFIANRLVSRSSFCSKPPPMPKAMLSIRKARVDHPLNQRLDGAEAAQARGDVPSRFRRCCRDHGRHAAHVPWRFVVRVQQKVQSDHRVRIVAGINL